MAPSKSNRKVKAKPLAQRKSGRRKANASSRPTDKENAAPANGTSGQDSPAVEEANTNDSHEQNWWKINVEKAASLIERCMKAYGWDRVETKRILNAYREFLLLKKEHSDWNATKLYPCWPVDQMWLQHSQMQDFDYDMRNLLGHVINRTPTMDAEEMTRLYNSTKAAVQQRFESYDGQLWDNIRVVVVDQLGEEETFDVNRREPLSAIFAQYVESKEESMEKFHFEFNGISLDMKDGDDAKEAEAEHTPMRLGIANNDKIEASHVDKVAVTIRHVPDKEKGYLIDKTGMISKTFDEYARDVLDIERNKLVFVSDGNRIYGYESPIVLNMKRRGNVIDAAAVESHKSKNCTCCSPTLK